MLKNRLLYRATFKWVQRMGLIEACAVVTDDEGIAEYAHDNGFTNIVMQETRLARHEDAFLLGVDALALLNLDGVVLAQVTSPFREDWLLEDVKASMQANPQKMTRVSSDNCPDTGALHGIPNDLITKIRSGSCDFGSCENVFVAQNDEAALDVDRPAQVLNVLTAKQSVYLAANLKRPVKLPKIVTIVGSDRDSLFGRGLKDEIESSDCVIRVNHLLTDYPDEVGTKIDYHFSKFEYILLNSPQSKRVCSESILTADHSLYKACEFAVTPKIEELYKGVSRRFVSTGMKAILWALHNGAEVCHLYGFGDGTIRDKYTMAGEKDNFAETEWLERETKMLNKFAAEGLIVRH